MKRIMILLVGLLALLVAAPAIGAPVDGSSKKEEVVYANLSHDGGLQRVYVVNSFPDSAGHFVDHGDYSAVVNLTNTDQVRRDGDRVTVDTSAGDFYYQGEMTTSQMPWLIDFGYELDRRPVTADEVMGSTGKLAIDIDVRPDKDVDPVFFEHYMLQISVNLDSAYFSNIASDGATIASNGEVKVVNLTSLPGKESHFRITADARNAHIGQVQMVGLPFEMFMDLPDTSAYLGDLVKLRDAIADLADGVGKYTDGAAQLADGSTELNTGAGELASGATAIAQGFDQLAAGRSQFDAGLQQYSRGVQEFSNGVAALPTGLAQFTEGVDQLVTGSSQLSGNLGSYAIGMGEFSTGLGQSAQGSTELVGGLAQLNEGLRLLTDQGKYAEQNLVAGSAQIQAGLASLNLALSAPLSEQEAQGVLGLLQEFSTSFEQFASAVNATDFSAFLTQLDSALTSLDTAATQLDQIAANLQDSAGVTAQLGIDVTNNPDAQALLAYMADQGRQVAAATSSVRSTRESLAGIDPVVRQLQTSMQNMAGQFDTIRGLITRLNAAVSASTVQYLDQVRLGMQQLGASYDLFHQGLVGYVDGVEQSYLALGGDPGLLSGAQQLSGGLTVLAENGTQLAAGATGLAGGAAQLHDGLVQLQTGAAQFGSQANQLVSGAAQLADGASGLASGHSQLLGGDAQFGRGLHDFASGVGTYADGMSTFNQGASELGTSGTELRDGAYELRNETSDMDKQMQAKMDEALADFIPGDYTLVSFASPKNTGIERVQFVYLLDAQTEPSTVHNEPTEEPKKSIWERILDIFR